MARAGRARDMFCHSQKSWAAILDGEVFAKGKVRVDAAVKRVNREGLAFWWSVERLLGISAKSIWIGVNNAKYLTAECPPDPQTPQLVFGPELATILHVLVLLIAFSLNSRNARSDYRCRRVLH